MALLHDLRMKRNSKRQQQRADVLAVDVGVGHQHDLVVAQPRQVELVALDAGAQRRDDRLHLLVAQDAVDRARSTLRILPRIGRIAWVRWSRPCLAGPPAESPSTMKSSHSSGLVDWQSASLPGRPPPPSRPLRLRAASRALRAASRATAAPLRLARDLLALGRVLLEPLTELVVDDLLHERLRLGVAELGLGLALELRLGQLDADDRGEALADVVAGEVGVLLLEDVPVARELVDQRGQRGPEALLVGAALMGVDGVREGVHRLGEPACSTASRRRAT